MLFPVYYLFRIAAGFTGLITSSKFLFFFFFLLKRTRTIIHFLFFYLVYLTCELHGFFNPNIIHFQVSLIWIGIPVGLAATIAFGYFYKVAMYTLTCKFQKKEKNNTLLPLSFLYLNPLCFFFKKIISHGGLAYRRILVHHCSHYRRYI
jgi:hypothetical protein